MTRYDHGIAGLRGWGPRGVTPDNHISVGHHLKVYFLLYCCLTQGTTICLWLHTRQHPRFMG